MKFSYHAYYLILFILISCNEDDPIANEEKSLTIFFINDPHSQLDNFSKIKHIVDAEKEDNETLLVCGGDIFSGSPYVDQYLEKGYPIVDVMNKTGFDISVIGNHEFDYGIETLNARMAQANFPMICANVDTKSSGLIQPDPFQTLQAGDLKITFLGLVETNGKPGDVIPATHPWKVKELEFTRHQEVINSFSDLKSQEGSDLLVALTHLGASSDIALAQQNSFIDMVIGGHTNNILNQDIQGAPVLMAGGYLSHLGKISLTIRNKSITSYEVEFIDLDNYQKEDEGINNLITQYKSLPFFDEVVAHTNSYHNRSELGCFYTEALRTNLKTDLAIQNSGGIRSSLPAGDISRYMIYSLDPFNNGSVTYTLTVKELEDFLIYSGAGFHISGVVFEQVGQQDLDVYDEHGNFLSEDQVITLGMNDYIPAVYDNYFLYEKIQMQGYTTAEAIINYLTNVDGTINYEGCNQYFQLD